MEQSKIYPVLLAGGTGTRLWPVSRTSFPKQFQTFFGDKSMLQQTLQRLDGLNVAKPIVVCNEEHRFIAAEQLRQLNLLDNNIILESQGRGTAPAIALAAFEAIQQDEQAVLLVLPADHVILDNEKLKLSITQALSSVFKEKIVTFGIKPTSVETGYGYIEQGEAFLEQSFYVKSFKEKPSKELAQELIASKRYLWNSGMFMFTAKAYLQILEAVDQELYTLCKHAYANAQKDLDFKRVFDQDYSLCKDISIDHAIMEKTTQAVVIPLEVTWSDIGSWEALWSISDKDQYGNVVHGEYLAIDSKNNFVMAENSLISTIGIDNLVIVQTRDAVLIADKSRTQETKAIVKKLQEQQHPTCYEHPHVFRPWGSMLLIDKGERYKVKRISVLPGKKVAMQMHYHHAEHWIIVSGTAQVTVNDQVQLLTENQSIYIPIGVKHSIENIGKLPLDFIEVQSGSYLDDDDVVRFETEFYR
ncbi:mannose-1-phosphate guanylyltransferase/mannose-6-phosphate isomerase [Psittacicella gerlachiana]|uniref:mannose-1-phosphate guanylyltransferase n=1 Tax=Psittacicella gerlachiana TaxID=2028574 RepID=A0A3A1Y7Z3_9GAMM|nr:mannose-1-phosphate guanylyltransferase/mannose-6-phosphate isomerase [Psittacicella gerlachiana]RIY33360.1 mannose-1-phosphate guanylyltransferase/mannose-6-phosphate isomerase [Psittacicella gerlachiana]